MTKAILFLVCSCCLQISTQINAQNIIYRGDKQYQATKTWQFEMNGKYGGALEVTVAKTSFGGYLMISTETHAKELYIGGTVVVFLIDGTTIKCTDKGVRDYVDDMSIALYNFTKDEINMLKTKRISRIRFSIIGDMFGPEAYTADNKKVAFQFFGDGKEYYETDFEISSLYEE